MSLLGDCAHPILRRGAHLCLQHSGTERLLGVGKPVKMLTVTEEAEPQETPCHSVTGVALKSRHEQKTAKYASHRANPSTDDR